MVTESPEDIEADLPNTVTGRITLDTKCSDVYWSKAVIVIRELEGS